MNMLNKLMLVVLSSSVLSFSYSATAVEYSLPYNEWQLISLSEDLPADRNTPNEIFGDQIRAVNPTAEYMTDWIMWSYDSKATEPYEMATLDEPVQAGKGYWIIQAADRVNFADVSVSLDSYRIGDTGPGGGIVFYLEPNSGGQRGLEVAGIFENTRWCDTNINVPEVEDNRRPRNDSNNGAYNTDRIIMACGETTAAGLASAYVWPNGQTDGYLPNLQELRAVLTGDRLLGGILDDDSGQAYWSSTQAGTIGTIAGDVQAAWILRRSISIDIVWTGPVEERAVTIRPGPFVLPIRSF